MRGKDPNTSAYYIINEIDFFFLQATDIQFLLSGNDSYSWATLELLKKKERKLWCSSHENPARGFGVDCWLLYDLSDKVWLLWDPHVLQENVLMALEIITEDNLHDLEYYKVLLREQTKYHGWIHNANIFLYFNHICAIK